METVSGHNPQDIAVLLQLIQVLDDLKIPYAIGGSLASSVHGAVRFTQDADLTVGPFTDRVDAFIRRLETAFYVSREAVQCAIKDRSSFNLIHLETAFKIDLFVQGDTAFGKEVINRRMHLAIEGSTGRSPAFVTPEDIVLLKLQWYRQGGEASERQWRDVEAVLTVQRGRLDCDYLKSWAQSLGIADLLEKAMGEAGVD